MFNNGENNLKRKKDGSFSNSTGSFRVDTLGNVYSYNQCIYIKITYKYKTIGLINTTKFSVTTSSHQSSCPIDLFIPNFELDINTLNGFDIENIDIKSMNDLGILEALAYLKLPYKKIKKDLENMLLERKIKGLENKKKDRIYKKIKKGLYSSEKNLIKALDSLDKFSGYDMNRLSQKNFLDLLYSSIKKSKHADSLEDISSTIDYFKEKQKTELFNEVGD